MAILLKNAHILNEEKITHGDILIKNGRIEKIASSIGKISSSHTEIDVKENHVAPGFIDDQVHFREPGLTHKNTIYAGSRAAIAGGVTSYIEQPNTNPTTTTVEQFLLKREIASKNSLGNYAFNFGGANDNLEQIKLALELYSKDIPAIKVFMGSSTGNMLVDNLSTLEGIFGLGKLIITHCEDEGIIRANTENAKLKYGDNIPMWMHPVIRNETACLKSSTFAVELARRLGTRLHVYHITTAEELSLFSNELPLAEKMITAEACIIHMTFTSDDYETLGSKIKQNPAVKDPRHKPLIIQAVYEDVIDIVATDDASHTAEEKSQQYLTCPSGAPMVQHLLPASIGIFGVKSLPLVVRKSCHNPAILFGIENRGFIREGYYADLVMFDVNSPWTVSKENLFYKCGWSPMEGKTFNSKVLATFVNGQMAYDARGTREIGHFTTMKPGMALKFNR